MLDGISALQGYTAGADITTLFENNFAAAIAAKRPLFIPAGEHVLKRRLGYQGPNPVKIFGSGKANSRIIFAADATSDGIAISPTSDKGGVELEDFAVATRKSNTGTAILLDFQLQAVPIPNGGGDTLVIDRFKPRVTIDDLIIGGDDNVDSYGFTNGIYCHMPVQARVTDVNFIGQRAPGGHNFLSNLAFYFGTSTNKGHPVEAYLDRCAAYFVQRGVRFEGMEGMFARGNHMVDVDVAFDFLDSTGRPHVECVGNHMNMNIQGVNVSGVREARIHGNSIYHRVGTPKTGVAIGVGGPNAQNAQITENFIVNNIDTTGQLSAIDIYNCDHGRIDGNQIIAQVPGRGRQGRGITLAGAARFMIVGRDNVFPHASSGRQTLTHTVSDSGVSNTIRT